LIKFFKSQLFQIISKIKMYSITIVLSWIKVIMLKILY